LTQKFASNTSLWEILRQFESTEGANYNFTQRGVPELNGSSSSGAGRLNYEMPVITVMPGHREQSTFVGLQQTLTQLGFDSGSALLRLSFRNSGRPLEEVMAEISQYFKGTENPAPGAHASDSAQTSSIPDPEKAAPEASSMVAGATITKEQPMPEPDAMDVDKSAPEAPIAPAPATVEPQKTENSSPTRTTDVPAPSAPPAQTPSLGRNVQIYAAPTSATPQAARRAWNEGDYVPTIEHAKSHQAALQAKTRNQRLLSDKELEEQEKARQEKIAAAAEKGSHVRIRLPDQTMIQTSVAKDDTAESLYGFVEQFLAHKEPFQLKYLSPANGRQVVIARDKKRLIQDLRFTAAELITFVWDEKASDEARLSRKTLAKEWEAKAETLEVKEPVVEEKPEAKPVESKAEGKRKAETGGADKESKLKNILSKGLFKR
jgi:tether containing UBX domain for GLUT4